MGFLAPWFLAGCVALGVPVFVHLLRRHVAVPRPVSSLMFFERGLQSSTRHHRLKHLLLFALRAALVLLMALAFANPFVRRVAANAKGRLLLIVLDNSFSMRAGTRFADAKQQALAVLAAKPVVAEGAGDGAGRPTADIDAAGFRPGAVALRARRGFSRAMGMRASANWDAGCVRWRRVPHGRRCSSVQRPAAQRHAGELCRHGDAGECHACASPRWRAGPRCRTGRSRAWMRRRNCLIPKIRGTRGCSRWWPDSARRRRARVFRWW